MDISRVHCCGAHPCVCRGTTLSSTATSRVWGTTNQEANLQRYRPQGVSSKKPVSPEEQIPAVFQVTQIRPEILSGSREENP